MNQLRFLAGFTQEHSLLVSFIENVPAKRSGLSILEAGCGQNWPLKLRNVRYRLTGVDIDKIALETRKRMVRDLDETIEGDLRSVDFDSGSFDVIYSSFVLEHIENAEGVLDRFYDWLSRGGIIILRIPDRDTVFGFVTRVTPFRFHVWYYKYIVGMKSAGKPGYGPYPTAYDRVVSRSGIHDYCRKRGLIIREEYGHGNYLKRSGLAFKIIRVFVIALSFLSGGTLKWRHNNLTFVLEKG